MSQAWKGYYLTAYGIAVKHGFVGTEEEWLETLVGVPGAAVELQLEEETKRVQWRLEGEGDWKDLFDVAALRDEVITETLETATAAAEQACQARENTEDAKKQVFAVREEVLAATMEAKTNAEQTAAAEVSALQAAKRAETASEKILGETETSAKNAANALEAAQRAKASETVVTESARQAAQASTEAVKAQQEVLEAAEEVEKVGKAVMEAAETAAEAKTTAQTAAKHAQTAQASAEESAVKAAENAKDLIAAALEAKSWAVGGTGTRAGEDTDNARYYKEQARQIAGGEFATPAEVAGAIENHNADEEAHPALREVLNRFRRKVLRVRTRDPNKNDFGLGDETVYLEVGPYTGTAEVAVQLSGELYDAANISHNGDAIHDGNFIISKEEC